MTSTHKEFDLRIVLLGKTGSGKSATGNTILGRKAFEVVDFIKSANKLCEKQEGVVCGKKVSIIDTPGLFNTAVGKEQLMAEIEKCVVLSAPGPHVFLLVLKLGVRFTKEERDTVKLIQENFGDEALRRTIILFTHTDLLKGKPLDEYITKSYYLQETVDICGGRYHSFNNEDRNHQDQITGLLQKISAMMEENEMMHYTLKMFKSTQIKKERTRVKIACAVAVLGIGVLGTAKIAGMIAMTFGGRTAAEKTAVVAESAVAATATEAAVKKILAALEKSVAFAGEAAAKKAVAAVEKALETSGEAAANKAVAAVEKAVETAGKAAANKAVAAVEKAVETAGKAAAESAVGTGVATQGSVTSVVVTAAVAAASAGAAAAAGKVIASGRVAVVAAAAVGGAAVAIISALMR